MTRYEDTKDCPCRSIETSGKAWSWPCEKCRESIITCQKCEKEYPLGEARGARMSSIVGGGNVWHTSVCKQCSYAGTPWEKYAS